jgi:Uma2 family endonuclease
LTDKAKIPEYWIVNPLTETILVYRLRAKSYQKVGQFVRRTSTSSALLQDFSVNVDEVFDAE